MASSQIQMSKSERSTAHNDLQENSQEPPPQNAKTEDIEKAIPSSTSVLIASPQTFTPPTPYSVFTVPEKRLISFLIAFASMFSPLSSFIYYPAITSLSTSLHASIELINLSITTYMVVSGVAPAIAGNLSDTVGRRPIYLGTMAVYLAANIGLAWQDTYAALLVLRGVQSLGSSATISMAYGVLSDIATPAERGAYIGAVFIGPNLAPSLGPALGGILAQTLSWRWIFHLLTILSFLSLLLMTLFLPETSRHLVGNGSIPPTGVHRTVISVLSRKHTISRPWIGKDGVKIPWPNPLGSVGIIFWRDTGAVMVVHSVFYMTYGCVMASMSSLFEDVYGLSILQAGVAYLPMGVGCVLSSYFSGRLMNRDYKVVAKKHNFTINEIEGDDVRTFPIEEARFRSAWLIVLLSGAVVTGYGWCLAYQVHVAVPLILQFFVGLLITAIFQFCSTILGDIYPARPASALAALNIVRCAFQAGGLAVLQVLIERMGVGPCFTLFGGLCAAMVGLVWMEIKWGMGWRLQREECEKER